MPTRHQAGGILTAVLVGLILFPSVAAAQDRGSMFDDLALEVDLDLNSKYVWRGINVVDDCVLQPSIDLSLDGFGLNIWGNLDLTDENDREFEFTEVDLTASYGFTVDSFEFGLGAIVYLFPTADGDTTELFASVGLDVFFAPTLTFYLDIDEVDGTYVTLSGSHTLEDPFDLGEEIGLSPEFSLSLGFGSGEHNEAYYGVRDGGFADLTLGLSVPYRLCESATVSASINYSMLLDDDFRDATDDPDNFWFGLGLAVSF